MPKNIDAACRTGGKVTNIIGNLYHLKKKDPSESILLSTKRKEKREKNTK